MEKTYNPKSVEERIYKEWFVKKAYLPEGQTFPMAKRSRKRFSIMLPPPNVTGNLHIGHAFAFSIEDALVRYQKLQGVKALWLPGFDHAGIATQVVVERELRKRGVSRQALGREKFIQEVWRWVEVYKKNIEEQLKKLGALPDWDRVRFTLDADYQESVKEAFVRLHEKGFIYRGERMINWCPRCQTVLSDIEVEYKEEFTKLFYIKYGPLVIATVRVEPMPGDTALAVNPKDARYKKYIGQKIPHPLDGRLLSVIADNAIDMNFGTGVIKVTPAHDPFDFELAKTHNLNIRSVIGFDGKMNENAGVYAGLTVKAAREKIIDELTQKGLIEKVEDYTHQKGFCSRCQTAIEPLISLQWFVKMKPLAEPLIEAVKRGEVKFTPPRFKKVFLHWLTNIQDWCISRQLWWGHQLPVWFCQNQTGRISNDQFLISKEKPTHCPFCGMCDMRQDEDVLDTWFSSGLWPFATLGWPEKTDDFKEFYPTSVLQTGYDILFFWVARMLMLGKELTGVLPFKQVYLDGLVRDSKGRKMSKSLGNIVDPLEIIDKYGADVLRFSLLYGASPGNDVTLDPSHLIGGRNFANKLWNIARFYQLTTQKLPPTTENLTLKTIKKDEVDKAFLQKLAQLERDVKKHMERYQLAQALQKIHNFTWHELADNYIEEVKKTDSPEKIAIIHYSLFIILRLLHPFMPFITQELCQHLFDGKI